MGRELKLTLFGRDVLSMLVWAHESWVLTDEVQRKINGWASRCLARITGQSIKEEARGKTQTMGVCVLVM